MLQRHARVFRYAFIRHDLIGERFIQSVDAVPRLPTDDAVLDQSETALEVQYGLEQLRAKASVDAHIWDLRVKDGDGRKIIL